MPPNTSVDPRQSRRHRPSTRGFETHLDGAHDSTEGGSEATTQRFPPRYSSHGAVASHFQAYGGETWMDFLRESGTDQTTVSRQPSENPAVAFDNNRSQPSSSRQTLPSRPLPRTDSSSSRSSDRKRRLTTAESPKRRPSGIRMHSSNAGDTSSDPIVLGSSPAPLRAPLPPPPPPLIPLPPSRTNAGPVRRQSDIVLPPWQPDHEVTHCPVCGRYFTFLFRKHHCRKCGRVVCSSCSPHRITIPRQFIVHPPTDNTSSIIDLTGDEDGSMSSFGPFRNPALGGGEEVRVCNPCVPDPNFDPPPQYNPAASSRYSAQFSSSSSSHVSSPQLHRPGQPRSSASVHDTSQTAGHGQTQRPRDLFSSNSENRRVNYHGSPNAAERWLPPLPNSNNNNTSRPYNHEGSTSRPITGGVSYNAPLPPNPISASATRANMFPRSMFTPIPVPPLQPEQPQPQPSRPRRQIAEEDECPICGDELPPKGPDNDEAERTQHIEECIALHSASPAPATVLTRTTSASLPTQRTRGMSNAGGGNGEGASSSNRMSHAARGMFPYVATEKDCTDDEGREAECIICLEDFEAGDKMARLVCWCKFHEKCIKEWWEKKGRGACPTHQLQE